MFSESLKNLSRRTRRVLSYLSPETHVRARDRKHVEDIRAEFALVITGAVLDAIDSGQITPTDRLLGDVTRVRTDSVLKLLESGARKPEEVTYRVLSYKS